MRLVAIKVLSNLTMSNVIPILVSQRLAMFSSRLLSLFPRLPKLKPRHVNLPMDTNLTKGFPGSLFKVLCSDDENRFNFRLPQLTWGVAALVGLTVEQDCNEESESDKEDEEYSDANDNSFEESW